MILLAQVAGSLALMAAITTFIRGPSIRHRIAPQAAVAVAVVAIGYPLVFGLPNSVNGLLKSYRQNAATDVRGRDTAGGAGFPAREDFLGWVDQRLPSAATVYLVCPQALCGAGLSFWINYRLAPRRFTDRPEQAQWLLFYGGNPAKQGFSSRSLTAVAPFAPGFVLAKERER